MSIRESTRESESVSSLNGNKNLTTWFAHNKKSRMTGKSRWRKESNNYRDYLDYGTHLNMYERCKDQEKLGTTTSGRTCPSTQK
jgi:thioesterase domain-containing protein